MRLNPAYAVLSIFLSVQFAIAAGDQPKVDFDQGIDAAAIFQRAHELAAKQLTPIPLVKSKLAKVKRNKNMIAGPGQYPPVSPLITGSAAYPLGVNLRADPKYPALDPVVLEPLEADWTEITAARSDLLSQASGWEGDNERLYLDGLQLDRDLAVLKRRQQELNTEIAQYNQACTTRPLPPDEYKQCVTWRDSLIRRKSQLDSDITQYNGRVSSWNQRSSVNFQRRGTLVSLIEGWERRIQQWIETAKKAMATKCRPLDTLESLPKQSSVFTGGLTEEFEAKMTFKSEPKDAPPCEVDLIWAFDPHPDIPGKFIGRIAPKTGRKTIFTSGDSTGVGTVILRDDKSKLMTGSIVNVKGAAK